MQEIIFDIVWSESGDEIFIKELNEVGIPELTKKALGELPPYYDSLRVTGHLIGNVLYVTEVRTSDDNNSVMSQHEFNELLYDAGYPKLIQNKIP